MPESNGKLPGKDDFSNRLAAALNPQGGPAADNVSARLETPPPTQDPSTDRFGSRLEEAAKKANSNAEQTSAAGAAEPLEPPDPFAERLASEMEKGNGNGDAPAAQPEPPDDFKDESPSQDELVEEQVYQLDDDGEEESELVHETGPVGSGEHVVKQGECISSIGKDTGHFWETIWNDAGNAELRELRKDPNVLLPDDRVSVPPLRRKEEPGNTEMRHRFVRRGEPAVFRVRVLDHDEPRANEPYTMRIDGKVFTGTTDAEGRLQCQIPSNARSGRLTVGAGEDQMEYEFELGHLDPVTELTGVQHRLTHLGFNCEGIDGVLGPRTRDALRRFQAKHALPESGEPDGQTRIKLREVHGS